MGLSQEAPPHHCHRHDLPSLRMGRDPYPDPQEQRKHPKKTPWFFPGKIPGKSRLIDKLLEKSRGKKKSEPEFPILSLSLSSKTNGSSSPQENGQGRVRL